MARVLIIGASKGIGLETTRQALEAGHQVRALARSAAAIGFSDRKLEKVRGDALVSKDIEAALNGIDVVIQTLGVLGSFSLAALLPRNARSGERYGKCGSETADLRHRISGQVTATRVSVAFSFCPSDWFLGALMMTRAYKSA